MGGIVGKLSFDRGVRISPATIHRMIESVAHRVPGAARGRAATHFGDGIGLACRDSEATASACVARNGTGRVRVVADADLSNAADLRRSLARAGHVLSGGSDAEVIAHAYEEWGDACVERLSGPFACAIWDEAPRRLLLARDHLGIRPLCFALLHGQGVVFGSEIKALLQDPSVGREWHPEAIDAYLALGYVPAPLTIYRRVSKLEPAHTLVVDGRRLTTRQYWDFSIGAVRAAREREAIDLLDARLQASVAPRAGDAAGVLLSGGVASTTISAALPGGATSVSVAVERDASDLARVSKTATHLGLCGEIDVTAPEPGEVAQLLAWHFDEPAADPAAVSQYGVFVAARRHVDVGLTGHGAAALWAGHDRHRAERFERDLRAMLAGPLAGVVARMGRALGTPAGGAEALSCLGLPPARACAMKHAEGLFDDDRRHAVYTRNFSWQLRGADPFARHVDLYGRCPEADPLTRALYVDARTFLPDGELTVADRAATAAGLRLRHPFLDRELADLAFALPHHLKRRGATGMYTLRQLAARRLPRALLPPRRRAPRHPWLAGALARLVPGVLLAERLDTRGIFSRPALQALWDEHRSGRRDHARRLWSVLMLELWFHAYIDGDSAAQPAEYAELVRAA